MAFPVMVLEQEEGEGQWAVLGLFQRDRTDIQSSQPASHSLSGSGRGKGGRREAECGMHALLAHVWLVRV